MGFLQAWQSKINFLLSLSNIHTRANCICSIINGNGEKDRGNVIFIYSRKYVSMNLPMLECDQITGLNMFRFGFFFLQAWPSPLRPGLRRRVTILKLIIL